MSKQIFALVVAVLLAGLTVFCGYFVVDKAYSPILIDRVVSMLVIALFAGSLPMIAVAYLRQERDTD